MIKDRIRGNLAIIRNKDGSECLDVSAVKEKVAGDFEEKFQEYLAII